jgi:hypothetical protein
MPSNFESGALVISIDTEQIWGHLDALSEAQFQVRYPDAPVAHDKLLGYLCAADVKATWFLVGGMALRQSIGAGDPRMAGLPHGWVRPVRGGNENTAPLWFRPAFIELLRAAQPLQEIGLHGGLSHLIWTDTHATPDVVSWELCEGLKSLHSLRVRPRSFSFTRNEEAYHEFLPAHGIRCFRGRPPALAWRLGRTLSGALCRAADELRSATPPSVWPHEHLPGLWNVPASMFLYPIGPSRARVVRWRTRLERFRRGLEAAARCRRIFHFCLHPENLAESPLGFCILEDMLDALSRFRSRGDIEVLTMSDVVDRMEKDRSYDRQNQQYSYQNIPATGRRF